MLACFYSFLWGIIMQKIKLVSLSLLTLMFLNTAAPVMAAPITVIQPSVIPGSGLWSNAYPAAPGSLSIVNEVGRNGIIKMETTGADESRSEIALSPSGGFGTVGNFINNGSFSYDYFQNSGAPSSTITPGFKFTVLDFTDFAPFGMADGFATFIFEPVYNGGVGTFDAWNSVSFNANDANFWNTKLYDQNGLIFDNTLSEWNTVYGSSDTFLDAFITSISFGIGSGAPLQTGYVDNLRVSNGQTTFAPEFEAIAVAAVPIPAALPLYATGLGLMGFLGWRKRRKKA